MAAGRHRRVPAIARRARRFDVDDFPVPTGREEDWRFTPARPARAACCDGAPSRLAGVVRRDLPDGVELVDASARDDPARHAVPEPRRPGRGPRRRAQRRRRLVVRCPPRPQLDRPVVLRLHGERRRRSSAGHVILEIGADGQRHRRPGARGPRPLADNVEVVVGEGAHLRLVSVAGLGRRRGARRAASQSRLGRDATLPPPQVSLGGDLVRVTRERRRTPARAATPSCSALVLRRRRPAPRAPAVRRPRRAALPQQRRLQGRAAGRRRAHGLDRRRADPRRGRGHRHLRAQPQPRADRRRARRLGAEPRDRDRRDRRRRPRQRHRPVRRRAAVLPAGSRGIPEDEARRLVVRGFFAELVAQIGVPAGRGAPDGRDRGGARRRAPDPVDLAARKR